MLSDLLLRRLVSSSGIPLHDAHRQPPTIDGSIAADGTGGSITLSTPTASAAPANPAGTGPERRLNATPATIENAAAGTGHGDWDFAADSGLLAVVIPADASPGTYESTLAFTTAPSLSG